MKTHAPLSVIALAACLLAGGCDRKKLDEAGPAGGTAARPGASAATPAAAPGTPGTAAAAASAAGAGSADYRAMCLKLCDKGMACAGAMAGQAAKELGMSGPEAKKMVEEASKTAPGELESCKKECDEDKVEVKDGERAELDKAKKCVEEPDCDKFIKCMELLGGEAKK
ncbi:MAG: hypothetical protein HY744_15925 [Deltaproteobacteria bacterium]|nr:hypothetical protein [Deltaproteobacteria bacterium]